MCGSGSAIEMWRDRCRIGSGSGAAHILRWVVRDAEELARRWERFELAVGRSQVLLGDSRSTTPVTALVENHQRAHFPGSFGASIAFASSKVGFSPAARRRSTSAIAAGLSPRAFFSRCSAITAPRARFRSGSMAILSRSSSFRNESGENELVESRRVVRTAQPGGKLPHPRRRLRHFAHRLPDRRPLATAALSRSGPQLAQSLWFAGIKRGCRPGQDRAGPEANVQQENVK